MTPVSGVSTGAVRPLAAAEKGKEALDVRRTGETTQNRKPATDEYVPEEKREPFGRYWLGRDEDGRPKIYFDNPERTAESPKPPEDAPGAEKSEPDKGPEGPEKPGRKKEERCVCNTDQVDREIEQLKRKKAELEQRASAETDAARVKDLERQLAQTERELSEKDNDAYRKQHSTFTPLA